MLKPALLRQHLTAAVPQFAAAPDSLTIFITSGRLLANGAPSLSFEYGYTLTLLALGFAGHADAVMIPVIAWIAQHQPQIFDNPELREKSIRFEAELLNPSAVDLQIEIDLTEPVAIHAAPVGPDADPSVVDFEVLHLDEAPPLYAVERPPARWQFRLAGGDGSVIAAWNHTAP